MENLKLFREVLDLIKSKLDDCHNCDDLIVLFYGSNDYHGLKQILKSMESIAMDSDKQLENLIRKEIGYIQSFKIKSKDYCVVVDDLFDAITKTLKRIIDLDFKDSLTGSPVDEYLAILCVKSIIFGDVVFSGVKAPLKNRKINPKLVKSVIAELPHYLD